ncbi:MAG TPA: ribosome maturation factor RimM [Bacteroidia bacterium]|nr:ribosome maturation factor RimM [Bacteroidia bacterium]
MDNLKLIGKIGKPNGIKGFVELHFNNNGELLFDEIHAFFIEVDNVKVPYIVEEIKLLHNKTLVKFENVNSASDAKKLTNKDIWVEEKFLLTDDTFNYIEYSIVDVNSNNFKIGIINDVFIQNNLKWFVVLNDNSEEILLPFNDDLIEKVDETSKTIFYKAIEGMY